MWAVHILCRFRRAAYNEYIIPPFYCLPVCISQLIEWMNGWIGIKWKLSDLDLLAYRLMLERIDMISFTLGRNILATMCFILFEATKKLSYTWCGLYFCRCTVAHVQFMQLRERRVVFFSSQFSFGQCVRWRKCSAVLINTIFLCVATVFQQYTRIPSEFHVQQSWQVHFVLWEHLTYLFEIHTNTR